MDEKNTPYCDCIQNYHAVDLECLSNDGTVSFISTPDSDAVEGFEYFYSVECISSLGESVSISLDEDDSCAEILTDISDGTAIYVFTPSEDMGGESCNLAILCSSDSGAISHQKFEINIQEFNTPPVISGLPDSQQTTCNENGSIQLSGEDSDIPQNLLSWFITSTDCSFEVSIDTTGKISWTCGETPEECTVIINISDAGEPSASDSGELTLSCINAPPDIISTAPDSILQGMHYSYEIQCEDPDNDDVYIYVDPETDECGGEIINGVYTFVSTQELANTACTAGIICSDGYSEVKQESQVFITPFIGNLPLRIVAANLSSGNYMNYDLGHGIRILKGLNPDVVLVQEMNYLENTESDYRAFAQEIVGTEFFSVDNKDFEIPNGVISKWPVLRSGYWDDPSLSNRELFWAEIDLPGNLDLFVVSVHLHTSPSTDQVIASSVIVDEVKIHMQENPGRFVYIVGGDFNGPASVSSEGFGRDEIFVVSDLFPVDDNDNFNTNSPRSSHYDFILGDSLITSMMTPVLVESTYTSELKVYESGLVFDTRTFSQDILDEFFFPALTTDSAATGMQHMAVIKDYIID
ncbi:MAG: endonuclease/exonuclease/phosphatase family protein [Deltaproteobacteria bacterium]|nr:endonuclease/exonuclease/phosphatase family protein [Deltaproteobacteria bacterium]